MHLPTTPNIHWRPEHAAIPSKSGDTLNKEQVEYLRNLVQSLEAMYRDISNAFNIARDDINTIITGLAAHKDSHDPEDGSDPLDTAAAAEIAQVQAAAAGSAHSFARSDHAHAISHGITDNHLLTVDGSSNNGEFAKFTAGGLEGRTTEELLGDIGMWTTDSPAFVTAKLSGLTDTYLPYHVSDAAGLADSPVSTDGTDVTMSGDLSLGTGTLTAAIWKPSVDSTTALQVMKADGTTPVVVVDTTNARIGLGGTPGWEAKLDIWGRILLGGDHASAQTTRTNATVKSSDLIMPHYLNAEEKILLFEATAQDGYNTIEWGGSSGGFNAVTAHNFYTASNSTTLTGTLRMVINNLGNIGYATNSPTELLTLGGLADRKILMARHTTANTAGNDLTVQAGGATLGATDKAGGDLILSSGTSTGDEESGVQIQGCVAGASGTADRSFLTMIRVLGNKLAFNNNTPIPAPVLATGGGATSDDIITVLQAYGFVTQS